MDQQQPQAPKPQPKQSLSDTVVNAVIEKMQAPPVEETKVETQEVKPPEVVDLDSLGTFVFQGKKYTPEDLRKEIMLQKDYTKKTQELSKYKKYEDNIKYDLENVRQNPSLADAFKKTYPEKYHELLDVVLNRDEDAREAGRDSAETALEDLPRPLLEKVKNLESKLEQYDRVFFEQKVQANQAIVDGIFDKNAQKYPYANVDAVINKAQSILNQNKDSEDFEMTEQIWDRIFKLDHQENEKRYADLYKRRVDEQLQKGEKAKDSGPGGLAPGRERKKVALEDVADLIIQDLQGR